MAGKTNMLATIASWLFILGIILAVISGFWPLNVVWTIILIIIGLIVGLLNVTAKEAQPFLLAAVSMVIISYFGGDVLSTVWIGLQRMLSSIIILTIPATLVVAIKQLFMLARN